MTTVDDDRDPGPTCCECGGPLEPLGDLGHLRWYRCRNCGMDQSVEQQRCWAVQTNDSEPPQWIADISTPLADLTQTEIDAPQCNDCGGSLYVLMQTGRQTAVAGCVRCGRHYSVVKVFEGETQGR